MGERIRMSMDGSIRLPADVLEKLGWTTASFLEYEVSGDHIELRRVEVDLFAEAMKKPDSDAFDKVLKKQKDSQSAAFEDFEKRIKDPPEVRPEDRPDFWD